MLKELNNTNRPLIIDGGLATTMADQGIALHDSLWSGGAVIEFPDKVQAVHEQFLAAGADIITTATYQLTIQRLQELGKNEAEATKLLERAIALAVKARSAQTKYRKALIAGSIGPFGAYLHDGSEYRGWYSCGVNELIDFHAPRLKVVANSAVDLIAFETIPCLDEIEAISRLQPYFQNKPTWLSVVCRNEQHLVSGESLFDAAKLINANSGITAIGVNCVRPEIITGIVENLRKITTKPLLVYPNAGLTWDEQYKKWCGSKNVKRFCQLAMQWRDLGVEAIGGCCCVDPEMIRALCQCKN